jgi:uncharacterized membrane protein HdeD (DUF308 family)
MIKKILFKIFGGLLGVLFIIFGLHLILNPLFNTTLEKINSVAFLIMGGFFIKYAITRRKRNAGK